MLLVAFLALALCAGRTLADHPDHDIFFTMTRCDTNDGSVFYDNNLLAVTRCGECTGMAFLISVKFSCSDPNVAELFSNKGCVVPEEDFGPSDNPIYAPIKIDEEKCTMVDLHRRAPEQGIMIRKFNLGYDAKVSTREPEKTAAKRDLEERDADRSSSKFVAKSGAKSSAFSWSLVALAMALAVHLA